MIEVIDTFKRELYERGFRGFKSVEKLWQGRFNSVPAPPGVYLTFWPFKSRAAFLLASPAFCMNGNDPTVDVDILENRWERGCPTLYIGKGSNLKRRLFEFVAFGKGFPVRHWGGRYVWQLARSRDLIICWMETPEADPRVVEMELINQYEEEFGHLPFANLRH